MSQISTVIESLSPLDEQLNKASKLLFVGIQVKVDVLQTKRYPWARLFSSPFVFEVELAFKKFHP